MVLPLVHIVIFAGSRNFADSIAPESINKTDLIPPNRPSKNFVSVEEVKLNMDGTEPLSRTSVIAKKQVEVAIQILNNTVPYKHLDTRSQYHYSSHLRPDDDDGPDRSSYLPVTPPEFDDPELLGAKLGIGEQKCFSDKQQMSDAGFPSDYWDPTIDERFGPIKGASPEFLYIKDGKRDVLNA